MLEQYGKEIVSFIAFVLVLRAMYGIERKQASGQAVMFVSQLFWIWSAVLTHNLFLVLQSVVLAGYVLRVWYVWFKDSAV